MPSKLKLIGLWSPPLVFICVLFYWPLSKIVSLGLSGDWLATFQDQQTLEAIWFTLWQSAVSTLICLLLGVPGAYILYRKKFRGQKIMRAIITVPLVLPTIVVAISFSNFDFIPAIPLILLANVFVNYSLVVRAVGGVWASMDNETEEAAALAGAGRFRTVLSITLPQLKPALVSAAALTFLFCTSSYGIILILGGGLVNSVETQIASAALQFLDLPKASALAMLQTALTLIAFSVAQSIAKRPIGLDQVDESTNKPPLDSRDWPAIAITGFVFFGIIVLPIATVLSQALSVAGEFSFENFARLAGRGERDILNISVWQASLNTLRNLIVAGTLSVGLGVLVSYLLSRTVASNKRRGGRQLISNRILDLLFLMPVGISSVVLGFGYLITFGDGPLPIRASWLVMPLVQALIAMPLVIRLVYPALVSIGSDHREAASLAGANASQTWWMVESGIIRNVLFTAAGFAAIASIGEFGATSLLAYGDQATLTTVLFALISRPGDVNYGMAMAVCAILIALTFSVVAISSTRISRRGRLGVL